VIKSAKAMSASRQKDTSSELPAATASGARAGRRCPDARRRPATRLRRRDPWTEAFGRP
jgi:hypothetical protein